MTDKTCIIVNPYSAAKSTSKEWPGFEQILRSRGFQFEVKYTEYCGHGTDIARAAIKEGCTLIVSVGGDGTMNEVLNGFFENGKPINPEAKLAVFSRGTGCDFIKSLHIKKDFEDFYTLMARSTPIKCDVGKATYRDTAGNIAEQYFLNMADVGIGGETTYRLNKRLKVLKGFLAYLIGGLITIFTYKNKQFIVNIDDGKIILNEKLNSIVIANGQYFGGGMKMAPDALLDDGLFDIIVLGNLKKAELLYYMPTIYKGEHLKVKKVRRYQGRKITVRCDIPVRLEIDGEQPGTSDAEFELLEGAITILK